MGHFQACGQTSDAQIPDSCPRSRYSFLMILLLIFTLFRLSLVFPPPPPASLITASDSHHNDKTYPRRQPNPRRP